MSDKLELSQKAAVVVVSVGAEAASQLYQYMDDTDVEKLTVNVAKLGRVQPDDVDEVMEEFYQMCLTRKVYMDGGINYAREVLEKAFGPTMASNLLNKVSKSLSSKAFSFLRNQDVKSLVSILEGERIQTIALVLSYLDADVSAAVIESLPQDKKIGVVENIAKMDSISPEAVKTVEEELKKRYSSIYMSEFTTIGGIDYTASIMNNIDRANEKLIFSELGQIDMDLAEAIRQKMFVFDDLLLLDNRSLQKVIRVCETRDIVYALKGVTDKNLYDRILSNMSKRMAETIESDLEVTTNVRVSDVEDAQQRIVDVVRSLEENGELVIGKGGKDEIIA